jgi:ERCC4-related helicase
VYVSIAKVGGRHGCRFLTRKGRLGRKRNCRKPVLLPARGKRRWRLSQRARLPRGKYRAVARAVDLKGNKERPAKRRNMIVFRVR